MLKDFKKLCDGDWVVYCMNDCNNNNDDDYY